MRVGLGCGLLLVLLLIGAIAPPRADALECVDTFDPRCRKQGVGPVRSLYELRSTFTPFESRNLWYLPYLPLGGTGFTPLDTILSRLRLANLDVTGDVDPNDRPKRLGIKGRGGGGLGTVMLGVRATFGEKIETELWCEFGGIKVLDHAMVVDGAFRPFDLIGLLD